MRKIIFVALLATLFTTQTDAQVKAVIKKNIETVREPKTKRGYNYILFDTVKDIDRIYSEYESKVQQAWDNKYDLDYSEVKTYLETEGNKVQLELDSLSSDLKNIPVYKGADNYQKATFEYISVMKQKMASLTKLGVIGANVELPRNEYNEIATEYDNVCKLADQKRNEVRQEKSAYERS